MFERPQGGERAILVQLSLPELNMHQALDEFKELAISAQAEIVSVVMGKRSIPEPKYYIGLGKAEEVKALIQEQNAELVLVNHELSPSQERNLERLFQCRVVDRSGLILDIFAQRARTFEGKLQVELAQLQHLSTRLVRGWTHLERQKGGIGLRGPGETQLETDRRLLRERIRYINQRLEKVRLTRGQNRRARQKRAMPTVSFVGYTNAGKSTLFNILSGAECFAADLLFATLDPTMRKVELPGATPIILADTVGFVRDLPHQLIEAFRATLEETEEADLLIHVIDIADLNWRENVAAVEQVLHELAVDNIPVIQVFNKIDCKEGWQAKIENTETGTKVWLSAKTGEGLALLKDAIVTQLQGKIQEENLHLTAKDARIRAQLYQLKAIIREVEDEEGGWQLTVRLTAAQRQQLKLE